MQPKGEWQVYLRIKEVRDGSYDSFFGTVVVIIGADCAGVNGGMIRV